MHNIILATKVGMTQVYAEDGSINPVTVLEVGPFSVDLVRTTDRDKYEAVKRAAGSGRRLSDCVAYQANLVVDNKRRLSVSHCNNDKSLE